MGQISACIFDLDGVVVDTAKYHYQAWKRLGKELNFDFSEDDNERLKGVSRMDSLNILLEIGNITLSEEDKLAYADKKNIWYKEFVMKMTPDEILPGVLDFFKELKDAGYKIALGSASKNAVAILEKLEIIDWFDVIIDGTKTKKAKPDPEVFLLGAKGLNIDPANCVVFEDAEAGVEAALNAEMYCVGIGSPKNLGKAHKVMPGLLNMNIEKLTF
ncbi:MAG: beta-phosphoglucomutase [Salinivirgaceae bacterium]|jgi:beta-phosphoglucomutase|nr:beta-phosphoglucomutase [Salinivirgaceae bacterium]